MWERSGSVVECLIWDRGAVGLSLTGVTGLCPWGRARHIYSSLVLVQPKKTHPCLTERLLVGRKESNQTNSWMNLLKKLILKKSADKRKAWKITNVCTFDSLPLRNFSCYFAACWFFSQWTFSKNSFRNTIRVSNRLNPDQALHFVGPDLCPIYLQRLSADDISR